MDAVNSASYRSILDYSRPLTRIEREYEVGAWYWCSYWHYVYKVVSVDGFNVTCYSPADGRTWTHCTALDRRDRRMLPSWVKALADFGAE